MTKLIEGKITELVCNIDDMTAEELAFACSKFLDMGALDCYSMQSFGKKGRNAYILTVLCEVEDEKRFAEAILKYTSSIGLRAQTMRKYFLEREMKEVETRYGKVRVKISKLEDGVRIKPEYDDVSVIAEKLGISYKEVYDFVVFDAKAAL